MTELEMIMQRSGESLSECSCKTCQSMCERTPCIGTTSDIITLINNGHIHHLSLTTWLAGMQIGLPPINMVQITDTPSGCPLLKNGLCSIHHIKPIDGKLASCKDKMPKNGKMPSVGLVALSWLADENKVRVAFIAKALAKYLVKTPYSTL